MNIYEFAKLIKENKNLNLEIKTDSKGKTQKSILRRPVR